MFFRLVYIINLVFTLVKTRYTLGLLVGVLSRDDVRTISRPGGISRTEGNNGESFTKPEQFQNNGSQCYQSRSTQWQYLTLLENADCDFSAPCHEEITIHIILMRKELKGVSTGELLVHTVHAVLIQFGNNSVDCL